MAGRYTWSESCRLGGSVWMEEDQRESSISLKRSHERTSVNFVVPTGHRRRNAWIYDRFTGNFKQTHFHHYPLGRRLPVSYAPEASPRITVDVAYLTRATTYKSSLIQWITGVTSPLKTITTV